MNEHVVQQRASTWTCVTTGPNERLHIAAEPGRVDDGKRARTALAHTLFRPCRAHDSHLQCALLCVPARQLAFTVASRFVVRHCEANLFTSCCVVCAR
eukprot:4972767-Prymnesium_polylepis.1